MITSNKFVVTLSALRKADACISGYNRLVRALQGREFTNEDARRPDYIDFFHDATISIRYIVDSNGMDDALWALRCIDNGDNDLRLFAIWCARQVEHLMCDQRTTNALDVAERHANGQATDDALDEAWAAAKASAWAAARDAAGDAAGDAARAAAGDAARAAAGDAAKAAAWAAASAKAAAWAAARAAARDAARDAAGDAAKAAAWAAARDAQKNRLIEMLEAGAFIGSTQPK